MRQDEATRRMLQALRAVDSDQAGGSRGPAEGKDAGSHEPSEPPPVADPTAAARADIFAEMVDRQRQATSQSIDRLLSGVLRTYRVK